MRSFVHCWHRWTREGREDRCPIRWALPKIRLPIKQHHQTVCVREPSLFDRTFFLTAYLLSQLWYYAKVAVALQRSHDVITTILRYSGQGRAFREIATEREGYLDLTSKTCMVLFLTRCIRHKGKQQYTDSRMDSIQQTINPLTPNDDYSGRTAPLTSKVSFYIFIQQTKILNILNMVHTLRFFLFKTQFGS